MSELNPDPSAVASAANESLGLADSLARRIVAASNNKNLTLRLRRPISGDAEAVAEQVERAAEEAAMAPDSLLIAYSRNEKIAKEQQFGLPSVSYSSRWKILPRTTNSRSRGNCAS